MITTAKYNKCEQNIWPKKLMKGILSKAYLKEKTKKERTDKLRLKRHINQIPCCCCCC